MRPARFLFLMIACALWIQGESYAVPLQQTSAGSSANASDHKHSLHASLSAGERPKNPTTSRKRTAPTGATKFRQPGPYKSGTSAKTGSTEKVGARGTRPAQSPRIARSTMASLNPTLQSSLNNVRHRSSNPGVVGASVNQTSGAGEINGTRMRRRP